MYRTCVAVPARRATRASSCGPHADSVSAQAERRESIADKSWRCAKLALGPSPTFLWGEHGPIEWGRRVCGVFSYTLGVARYSRSAGARCGPCRLLCVGGCTLWG